ncbi:MAG: TRAP transporter small permease [Candidatus Adiutrix sp.]|jgi:TRAP-type C4-dicarboxylate transport system permease small subunit|nr:TRAP transporter small permease [Candidatus Adiutrix sp.]
MTSPDIQSALNRDNLFSRFVAFVMVLTAVFVVVIIDANSAMRYLLRKDIRAVEEIIAIAAFWMYFAGAVYAAKRRVHISAEVIGLLVKNVRILYFINLFRRLATFLISLIFTWWGGVFFWWSLTESGRTNVWRIPLIIGQCPVTFGLAAMLVYAARDLILLLSVRPSAYRPGSV